MILLLDNYDSFTYNLVDYFGRLGATCDVRRNDVPLATLTQQPYRAVVLSPGPGRPAAAGRLMEVVDYYATRLPMLGICLGHQAIGEYYGARLRRAARPVHGKCSLIYPVPNAPEFEGISQPFEVVRYHSLVLTDLPPTLRATARTAEGEIMSLRHATLPLTGWQFHPEAILTRPGLRLLSNWLGSVCVK